MENEKKKVLCPDPDCNTENDAGSESCSKCSLDLSAFFTLDRVMTVREKAAKRAQEEIDKKKAAEKPVKRSGLASLTGRKQ